LVIRIRKCYIFVPEWTYQQTHHIFNNLRLLEPDTFISYKWYINFYHIYLSLLYLRNGAKITKHFNVYRWLLINHLLFVETFPEMYTFLITLLNFKIRCFKLEILCMAKREKEKLRYFGMVFKLMVTFGYWN